MNLSSKLKLLIVLQDKGRYYTGLGESYVRAFNKYDINLSTFNLFPDYVNGLKSRLAGLFKSIESSFIKKLNEYLVSFVDGLEPNAILVIKGAYLSPDSLRLLRLKHPCALLLCLNPDDPFNSNKGASNNRIRESIKLYDIYITWSKNLVTKLKQYGANEVIYLPFAADPEIIYPVKLSNSDRTSFDSDVSFIGNCDEERESWIYKVSKIVGEINCDLNFRLYGDGWKNVSNVEIKDKVEGLELLKALSGSKINLNILRLQNKNSHNMRTFEIPASGGFMLHERSDEAMDFFKEGKEAEYFSTPDELLEKSEFYLKNDDLRKKISKAGYEKIFRAVYTYENMAKQLLSIVSKNLL